MNAISVVLAPAVAFAAALAFYPALRLGPPGRAAAWLAASGVVAASPALIPTTVAVPRLAASLVAIALLVKLYDVHRDARLARGVGLRPYLAYLANWFWLVLRREPGPVPAARDRRRLAVAAPASLVATLLVASLWRPDWIVFPFFVEHTCKVAGVVGVVVLIANTAASAWRLLGGRALDPMRRPLAAPTPAEFWRRWNRPAQAFFHEYAFGPAGGPRRAVWATLVTFGVSGLVHEYVFGIASGRLQGRQMLFFLLQGGAAAATLRVRPSGRARPAWIAGTLAFQAAASVLFFQSVDAVLPFYAPRGR